MKLLIDTNVVFEVFERRQPHYSASVLVLKLARSKQFAGAVATQTISDAFYRYGKACIPFLKERLLHKSHEAE